MDEELAKLLERKEKADKLPEKQLEKWKPEYEKLVKSNPKIRTLPPYVLLK